MKKKSLILLLAIFTTAASAQSLIPTKFGIKAGLNIANITSTTIKGFEKPSSDSKMGLAGGFVLEIALSDKWFIKPELLFSQKGATFYYDHTHDYEINQRDEYTTSNELTLSYIDLNINLSYKATDKIALNFGPSVSYLVAYDYAFTQSPTQSLLHSNILLPGTIEAETIDVGINSGISYYLTENFVFDAKVYTGFSGVVQVRLPHEAIPINSYTPPTVYILKNNAFAFSFTYLF